MGMDAIRNIGATYQENVSAVDTSQSTSNQANQQPVSITEKTDRVPLNGAEQETGKQEDENSGRTAGNNEALKKAVSEINKKTNTEAVFGIHKETNHVIIKIIDKDTKKVLREYPPEETLDMIAKVWELAGILVDEKR